MNTYYLYKTAPNLVYFFDEEEAKAADAGEYGYMKRVCKIAMDCEPHVLREALTQAMYSDLCEAQLALEEVIKIAKNTLGREV